MSRDVPLEPSVSLVIPGHNVEATLRPCLESVVPLKEQGKLAEIFFVDDRSTDRSVMIAEEYPVRCLTSEGRGAGAARNKGWQTARSDLVWFIDADCVASPGSLTILLEHFRDPEVFVAGGSYDNLCPGSLLATIVHEEIVERHRTMPREVDFLATFNVIYRRDILTQTGGFDERLLKSQDAELAYRVQILGGILRFDQRSRVGHYHPVRLLSYLSTQARQGFWRVYHYAKHPRAARGDVYNNWYDYLQPILAVALVVTLPLLVWEPGRLVVLALALGLVFLPLPMTVRLLRREGAWRLIFYTPLAWVRALARGLGMVSGVRSWLWDRS